MTLDQITHTAIEPAFALLPARMDSPEARVIEMASGLQESGFVQRFQAVQGRPDLKGPARSFWQLERGTRMSRGGVCGVLLHPASRFWLHELCVARGCAFTAAAIWRAIETDDVLAAGVARLLLFTDHRRLPDITDVEAAWATYLRCWRPGKPRPKTWPANHEAAYRFVAGDV